MKLLKLTLLILLISGLGACSGRTFKRQKYDNLTHVSHVAGDLKKIDGIEASQIIDGGVVASGQGSQFFAQSLHPSKHLIKTDEMIKLSISKNGYTRMYMDEERITDVFVYPQELLRVQIHNQGYLIVVPNLNLNNGEDTSKEKVFVTLTGEKGTTQDLSLSFTGKHPEPVGFVKLNLGANLNKKGD